jgi:ubiquinone/menaquinone biosynthesis C-methylase UbiE
MSVQEAYDHWSATYDSDANLTRDLDAEVTRETLGNLHFKSILEVGCGTGKNTSLLSQIGEKVFAIDFSAGMLRVARQKLISSNIIYCVVDVTKPWPFEADSADLVTCNLVLEHIEDLSHVFSEAYRSLAKGGHLFVNELHPFRQYQEKKARFQRERGTIEIKAFVHHISDFLNAAEESSLALERFRERWRAEDQGQPPRLVSFVFKK